MKRSEEVRIRGGNAWILRPFVQVSSDATRRLCEQGQCVAKTISDWSSEASRFLTHRVARNGEALGRGRGARTSRRFSQFKHSGCGKLRMTT